VEKTTLEIYKKYNKAYLMIKEDILVELQQFKSYEIGDTQDDKIAVSFYNEDGKLMALMEADEVNEI
jgi:hypothetical protein